MSSNNPDFSLAAKRLIVKATQRILATPQNMVDTAQPASPRGGGGLPQGTWRGQLLTEAGDGTVDFEWASIQEILPTV